MKKFFFLMLFLLPLFFFQSKTYAQWDHPATQSFMGYTDTTSTAGDTLIIAQGSIWWEVSITADDTIQMSMDPTYPVLSSPVLLPNSAFNSGKHYFNIGQDTVKIYYKCYGSGKPNVYLYWRSY